MKIGNWHIIHDRELRQKEREREDERDLAMRLKRILTPSQIQSIMDGKGYYSRMPIRKKAAA
jgi:hypothetical protein